MEKLFQFHRSKDKKTASSHISDQKQHYLCVKWMLHGTYVWGESHPSSFSSSLNHKKNRKGYINKLKILVYFDFDFSFSFIQIRGYICYSYSRYEVPQRVSIGCNKKIIANVCSRSLLFYCNYLLLWSKGHLFLDPSSVASTLTQNVAHTGLWSENRDSFRPYESWYILLPCHRILSHQAGVLLLLFVSTVSPAYLFEPSEYLYVGAK